MVNQEVGFKSVANCLNHNDNFRQLIILPVLVDYFGLYLRAARIGYAGKDRAEKVCVAKFFGYCS